MSKNIIITFISTGQKSKIIFQFLLQSKLQFGYHTILLRCNDENCTFRIQKLFQLLCSQELNFLLLAANMAPVRAPLVIEFHGSSLPLILTILQSIMEKRPPQTAKLPVGKLEKRQKQFRESRQAATLQSHHQEVVVWC